MRCSYICTFHLRAVAAGLHYEFIERKRIRPEARGAAAGPHKENIISSRTSTPTVAVAEAISIKSGLIFTDSAITFVNVGEVVTAAVRWSRRRGCKI